MIIKSFELEKIKSIKNKLILIYGSNQGYKNQVIKDLFEKSFEGEILRFDEIEILNKIDASDNTFILLDNGSSTDEIKAIAQKKSGNNWKFIRTEQNLGFGGGIRYAAKFVEKDYVAWMPGNLKLNPSEVYKVLSEQNLNEKY